MRLITVEDVNSLIDRTGMTISVEKRSRLIAEMQNMGIVQKSKLELVGDFYNHTLNQFDGMSNEAKRGAFSYLFDLMMDAVVEIEETYCEAKRCQHEYKFRAGGKSGNQDKGRLNNKIRGDAGSEDNISYDPITDGSR